MIVLRDVGENYVIFSERNHAELVVTLILYTLVTITMISVFRKFSYFQKC